jgi:hypothetical protein
MLDRPFQELLRAYGATGQISGLKEGSPVLVRYDEDDDDASPQRAYRTAFGRVESAHGAGPSPELDRDQELGIVVSIVKKEGAPFPEQIGLGRAANTDVCLPLGRMSKYHAFFREDGKGGYVIADAGSKNGTWVDGSRLAPKHPVAVVDRSRIRVGPYKFLFYTWQGLLRLLAQRSAL